jgi:hypothetical protein
MPADAKWRLHLTNELKVVCPDSTNTTNFDYNSRLINSPLEIECSNDELYTILLVKNPISTSLTPNEVIRFTLTQVLNPLSARKISGLKVETLTHDLKVIDTYESFDVLFTVLAKPIFGVQIKPQSNETFTLSKFDFSLTLANKI